MFRAPIATLLPALLLASPAVLAETLIVDPDGHGDHTTIQGAIDAAGDGDVIEVWRGTYAENLVIDKGLELRGAGAELTVLEGRFLDSVVNTSAAGAEVLLADMTITDGLSDYGGGVYCTDTFLSLERVTLMGNQATNNGGALGFDDECTLSMRDCDVSMNQAGSGGGIGDAGTGAGFVIEGSRFVGNMASGDGAGMFLYDEDGTLRGNVFSGNQAADEGGVFSMGRINAQVLNNIFVNNAAASGAVGHVYIADSHLRMVNNTAVGNEALEEGYASVLAIDDCELLSFANNIVAWQEGPAFVEDRTEGYDCWMDFEYSAFHEVGEFLYEGELDLAVGDEGNIDGDPLFVLFDANLGTAATDDYHLQPSSPCVDAGIPSYTDPDDSPGDMGAFGGIGGGVWDWDQDGWTAVEDCDDSDDAVHPDAEEADNGVDDDCDGEIDEGLATDTDPPEDTGPKPVDSEPPEDTGSAHCDTEQPEQDECPECEGCGCAGLRSAATPLALLLGLLSLVVQAGRRREP